MAFACAYVFYQLNSGLGWPVWISVVAAALREVGCVLADVVRTRIYVTDITRWQEVAEAHQAAFGNVRPASTMVEVSALIDPGLLV